MQTSQLQDLSERIPREVRLPEPTELTTRRARQSGGWETETRDVHLRVLVSDFGDHSIEAFQSGATATIRRALPSDSGGQSVCAVTLSVGGGLVANGFVFAALFWGQEGEPGVVFIMMVLCFAIAAFLVWRLFYSQNSSRNAAEKSATAVARNCRLLAAKERSEDGGEVMPVEGEKFDFISKGFGKANILSIDSARELVCIRLVQLIKFGDQRALRYFNTTSGQALLDTLTPAVVAAV